MRDRLIELLEELGGIVNAPDKVDEDGCGTYTIEGAEYVADYLLANGVIVPPVKVGDTVWYALYRQIKSAVIYSCEGYLTHGGFIISDANAKSVDGLEVAFDGKCLGKTVFLTREEAERVLKGGESDA